MLGVADRRIFVVLNGSLVFPIFRELIKCIEVFIDREIEQVGKIAGGFSKNSTIL